MKMKYTLIKHSTHAELKDGRKIPIDKVFWQHPTGPTVIKSGDETINLVEAVKYFQGEILLYEQIDYENETVYCEACDTIDDPCWRDGEVECNRCHTSHSFGVLRECSVCLGEFVSKEGECVCEVCMDKGGIAWI